ncbi:MAG: response regulator [Phycisphaerales bacterium]
MRILVVDDRAENRYLLETLLAPLGHEVTSVSDGQLALEAVRTRSFDAVISDILMPRLDGFALCRELKGDPRTRDIPFLFYTATYTDARDERLALSLGADRFLIKPVEPDVLVAALHEAVARQSRADAAPTPPVGSSQSILEQYNRALVLKLESKMLELEKAHASLAESEQRLRELYQYASDCIFLVGVHADGAFVYEDINRSEELHSGLRCEDVRGKSPDDLFPPPRAEWIKARYRACIVARRPISFEEEVEVAYDGRHQLRQFDTLLVPISRPDGTIYRIAGFARDLTDMRRSEQAEARLRNELESAKRLRELGQLAAGVAHDFNNLLMAIQGNASLARSEIAKVDASGPARLAAESLDELLGAVARARGLVSQILTVGRSAPASRHPLELSSVVREAVRAIRATLPANVHVEESVDHTGCLVLADEGQIHQVVMNLCTNAVHAMRDGGTLRVTLERSDRCADGARGLFVRLAVADTGHGMDADTRSRIFEPFFTTKPFGKGTGLGLALVRNIAQEHHAELSVESEVGRGTTFTLCFPVVGRAVSDLSPELRGPAPRGRGERVLVIDDDAAIVSVVTTMLGQLGYAPVGFHLPPSGLAAFLEDPKSWNLAIVDLNMPVIDGGAIVEAMRAARPDLPIVVLSGAVEGGPDTARRATLAANVADFAPKPIDLHALGHIVARALARHAPAQA